MQQKSVKKIVILGGGTAGWISASLLVKILGKVLDITLVESEDIGTIGVGEATIPPIQSLNAALGLQEEEFLRETMGTIKLGIQFEHWGDVGESYMHAFGTVGKDFPFCHFNHFWRRADQLGMSFNYWDFSLNYQASLQNKFSKLDRIEGVNLGGLTYAYHFDAGLYARFLRKYSESVGVKRIEGKVASVQQDPPTGDIQALLLQSGQRIEGDLFLDCSGLHSLLIDKTLNTGFEDWSHWLPADSAVAVPSAKTEPVVPYTRSIAHANGWQWRIPLQHRTGNGFVYSSKYCTDEEAKQLLLSNLDSQALAEPRLIKFRTGRRLQQWQRNVVSIGLASGFLEPLESTSIHLIQSAVLRLLKFFPHLGINDSDRAEYNRQSKIEFEQIRDFIILHYKLTRRQDSKFWRDCKQMAVPASLERKLQQFAQSGLVFREQDELFSEIAWQQVMLGQGLLPADHHPLVDALTEAQLQDMLQNLKVIFEKTTERLGSHQEFLARVAGTRH
ncbi:tryptophan halogenase family protein [Rheinheimera sp.]|uniref:tryptophan halogenase family protein n=1 Tax=Rheinheimera sp. TaxID=1869214 RepID=UPI003AF66E64